MKTELVYLTWVTVLTALLWIPYILERVSVGGLSEAVGEIAAGEHAGGAADEEDRGEEMPAFDQAEAEAALEHRRRP